MVLKRHDFTSNGFIGPRDFSFDRATLERTLKSPSRFQAYDKSDPSTRPLVSQDIIDKHCGGTYTGLQSLPRYVAYESAVMATFLKKWPKKQLTADGTGDSLHSRYPCNFSQTDIRKSCVGMTTSEEQVFIRDMTRLQIAEADVHGEATLNQRKAASASISKQQPPRSTSPCQDGQYTRTRQHNANFREASAVSSEVGQGQGRYTIKMDDPGYQISRLKGMLFGVDGEYARARSRAMRGEQELLNELSERIGQEERANELETKCAELLAENKRLEGPPMADKQARCEDCFSEDEARPEKRARSEN